MKNILILPGETLPDTPTSRRSFRDARLNRRVAGPLCAVAAAMLFGNALLAQQPKFDPTTFVVLGEGLAAGMADFSLVDVYQKSSFPAVMAAQMNTAMPIPLIQQPGIGNAPGFPAVPARLPGVLQGSVREPFPPYLFVLNLSVPNFRLADSLSVKPAAPLIQANNPQQTMVNMILGYPALITGPQANSPAIPLWSQSDYAVAMNPTLALVELGYYDVLQAAIDNNPAELPATAAFQTNYSALLAKLYTVYPTIIASTIPDPFDTAYFTSLTSASRLLGASSSTLQTLFDLKPGDYLTPNGLMAAGAQINVAGFAYQPLPAGSVVSAATATAVHNAVTALNGAIAAAAKGSNASVYDLKSLLTKWRASGITAGGNTLTADYLGGIYTLDGYYPGLTGHTAIANDLLSFINTTYSTSYKLADLNAAFAGDPAGRLRPAVKKRNLK